ncbi:MAG: ABC transporter ATP-binding protein [Alteromonadales bacterium]|nr:ABC transporter ATP-binding protein [Alteromonadales bacterium]
MNSPLINADEMQQSASKQLQKKAVLEVKDLSIHYIGTNDITQAVKKVSFSIQPGEVLGLAGESGCGKSTIAFAIARLTSLPGLISDGEILFKGDDVLRYSEKQLRCYRWACTSLVFQSAMDSLNPVISIKEQICDTILAHKPMKPEEAVIRARELMMMVDLDPDRLDEYPHQFSGGMRQRIGIALAMALEPELIIMDEPTTALDVVVQRDIIEKIFELKEKLGFAVLFISHDLSMMAEFADRIGVMKEGVLLEIAPSAEIWDNPKHDYTKQLGDAFLTLDAATGEKLTPITDAERLATPLLELKGVHKIFKTKKGWFSHNNFTALNDVSFKLRKGRALALVGESGSGKSTCARILSRVYKPSGGVLNYKGVCSTKLQSKQAINDYQKAVQMIFQDPFSSLNPTLTIGYHLRRPLELHHQFESEEALQAKINSLLEQVELLPVEEMAARYPHELSGGQRQRVAIARVLAIQPDIILADEPTSMLDVSLRTGVLDLLQKLKEQENISFLYITHDMATARYFAEETAILYRGNIVEWGDSQTVANNPQHPYTQLLLDSVPDPKRPISERIKEGKNPLREIWDPLGKGCVYSQKCSGKFGECSHMDAPIVEVGKNHFIRQFEYL